MMHEWTSDNKEQTIIHQSTGSRFTRYPIASAPLVNGFTLPFERSYEIPVKFAGMRDNAPLCPVPRSHSLAAGTRRAALWILTYTFESSRRRT